MAGTAVFRIVVSSASMKNATATSQGNSRFMPVKGSRPTLRWCIAIASVADINIPGWCAHARPPPCKYCTGVMMESEKADSAVALSADFSRGIDHNLHTLAGRQGRLRFTEGAALH